MTKYFITFKPSTYADDCLAFYKGDLRGAMDFIQGLLTVPATMITNIKIEEEGEAQ